MSSPSTVAALDLPPGAKVVVTGQQVGLLTGPLLTVLKAARAISYAAEVASSPATAAVVPLFWAAADDHDLAEVHHTYALNAQEEAQKFRIDLPLESAAASEVEIPPDSARRLLEELFAAAGVEPAAFPLTPFLPVGGDTLASWFCRALRAVLGTHAPRIVVPAQLNRAGRSVYDQALRDDGAIRDALAAGAAANQAAGLATPLPVDADPPLFVIERTARWRVRHGSRSGEFRVGEKTLSRAALLDLAHDGTPRLSANVALRTILQAATLPCIAYVAGPTELLYYRQLEPLHRLFAVPFPTLVRRPHATLLTTAAARAARKLGLEPDALRAALDARAAAGPDRAAADPLLARGEQLRGEVAAWLATLQEGRPALKSATERRSTQLLQSFDGALERARATLADGALHAGARWSTLERCVRPRGRPQERVLNILPFLAERGPALIEQLLALRGEPGADGVVPHSVL